LIAALLTINGIAGEIAMWRPTETTTGAPCCSGRLTSSPTGCHVKADYLDNYPRLGERHYGCSEIGLVKTV
jgi:hypothetical protein